MTERKLELIATLQRKLAGQIVERPLDVSNVKTVAAVDVSYRGDLARAAFVLCSFPECELLRANVVEIEVSVPYIPTYFFLRETRPVLLALRGEDFDVLLVEGHGRAHPRGYGLASHIGLLTGRPTVGVAKRPLRGVPEELFRRTGKAYVSVGNLIDLGSAVGIVEPLLEGGYPKPLKLADRLSKRGEQ
ncbi:endonuclease V [Thermococcus pacificus]|uniref:Endonuclease V n=1 Tax=Thermococcus pacificus TaxID=71998 RepID=A0A218PA66_9EURY|nr:endonuclease V [Thermococcus pacificus]